MAALWASAVLLLWTPPVCSCVIQGYDIGECKSYDDIIRDDMLPWCASTVEPGVKYDACLPIPYVSGARTHTHTAPLVSLRSSAR